MDPVCFPGHGRVGAQWGSGLFGRLSFPAVCLLPACPNGVEHQECQGLLSPAWLTYLLL